MGEDGEDRYLGGVAGRERLLYSCEDKSGYLQNSDGSWDSLTDE